MKQFLKQGDQVEALPALAGKPSLPLRGERERSGGGCNQVDGGAWQNGSGTSFTLSTRRTELRRRRTVGGSGWGSRCLAGMHCGEGEPLLSKCAGV